MEARRRKAGLSWEKTGTTDGKSSSPVVCWLLLIGGVAAAERLNQMDPASRGLTGTPSGVTFWRAEQEDVEIPDEAAPKAPAPRAVGDAL